MFEIMVEDDFAAGHFLRRYNGKCENLHGHNYRVKVFIQSNELDVSDLSLDFGIAKQHLKDVLEELDHKCLNDLKYFPKKNPSAENIAKHVYDQFKSWLTHPHNISKVTIWETARNAVSYWEP